ncbi:ribosome maturation factor RimM [Limosilactobacillus sp.]|jgi:16S rRNA processing protein RimM|uniref:ribosome maturation factor RimM n=1 Tax=Limosilactobacillus sp. TaxID=2773925 RepID=UPI0025BB8088|nr:ribosome maturation factor RimM [Limosilactobacillus sp.]MCH3923016.1 ribosome maturation factor RimM [Limosilactobacillus sp.]MCH3927699.1 ribosome maturation factor RimM [Limosilactobacillus sp.]
MEFYNVGKIVNTHGIRGEVRVMATTDFVEERFAAGETLYLQQAAGEPLALTVESARPHKGFILVKFKDYDNINDVQGFRNRELLVSAEDQQPLEDGQYYYHQIIGLKVKTVEGRELGTIKEILSPGANDVWVVKRSGKQDLLLPVIDDVVKTVDLENGEVIVELMEGLE